MTQHESALTDMLKRVETFGLAHAADFPAGSLAAGKLADVTAALPQVNRLGADQVSGAGTAHSATRTKALTHAALHADLLAVSDNAHALARLGTPGLEHKFRLPRSGGHQALLNAARAFAADAAPLKDQFLSLNMPADFLDALNSHIEQFEAAMKTQTTGSGEQAGATAWVKDTLHTGFESVRVLDRIVRNTYAANPALLAEWTVASHVTRPPHPAKPQPPTPQPPVQ
jgi:hypothetical protein